MEEMKMENNEMNGFLNSCEMIDSLIVDCNELPKRLFSGNYVSFCNLLVQMVQKLSLVREGITKDRNSLEQQIENLKSFNSDLLTKLNEGGSEDGRAQDNSQ